MIQEQSSAKANLRRTLLQTRQSLPVDVWRQQSDRLCHRIHNSTLFQQAKTILAYFSWRQEPDLGLLFAMNSGQHIWGFPRCVKTDLVWHTCSPDDLAALQVGPYGILEPKPSLPILNVGEVDLILVPAIACDAQGYRLGYGGGFYDRLLSGNGWHSKPTVGIIFEFALLASLPIDPWDQPLKAVCTEVGLLRTC